MPPAEQSIPKEILIIRLGAIGDLILASILVPGLRKLYPDARLSWLVLTENVELVRMHETLDEVIVWPRKDWRQLLERGRWLELARAIRAFFAMLRGKHFDMALDTHGLMKSAIWAWASGAKRRIAINPREGSGLLISEALKLSRNDAQIGSEYLAMLEYLGLPRTNLKPSLPLTAELKSRAQNLLDGIGVTGPFVAICPFTTRPQKHWFADRWREVIGDLAQRWPGSIVVLGGPGDLPATGDLLESGEKAYSLVGQTTVGEALAVLSLARLAIGVDTGLTHMALACETPTLALFGATRPYLKTDIERSRVLYDTFSCSPCRRRPTCDSRYDCMRSLTPSRVRDAALELLKPDPLKLRP